MRPPTFPRRATLVALGAAALSFLPAATARADFFGDLEGHLRSALSSGNWGVALGISFLAGIGTSLTPCVYPMIAITVSVFGARQAKSRLEGAKLSTAFVLGICALFTPLGLFAAVTGSAFGTLAGSVWVIVPLAVLFVALAASMFGAFELNLPPSLANRLSQVGGVGVKGAFALGLVSSVIAAPCTGPVLGLLLGWIGTSKNVGFGAVAMASYALGLGLLTWIVGTFAIALPKSGRWVEWSKSIFGLVMLAAAGYFLSNVIPGARDALPKTSTVLGIAVGLLVLGVALGAVHRTFHGDAKEKVLKGAGVALATAGLLGFVGWLVALPPGARIQWQDDYAAARAVALREHKPMLVDFGASWCGACGELDRNTFTDPRVVRDAERFVAVRVDMSQTSAAKTRLLRGSYHQTGLPLVVVHGSDGREVTRLTRFAEPDEFVAMLAEAQ